MIVFDYKGYQESRRRPESTKYYVRKKIVFFYVGRHKNTRKICNSNLLTIFQFSIRLEVPHHSKMKLVVSSFFPERGNV